MWEHLGYEGALHEQPWPEYDEKALVKDSIEIVVQINGKIKDKINIPGDMSRDDMMKLADENDKIKALTEGKNVVKVIAVPGKLINLVVKG
ncbi:MAG: class I tRNA ligase family protein [Anaerovoracaceae bacterium]